MCVIFKVTNNKLQFIIVNLIKLKKSYLLYYNNFIINEIKLKRTHLL